MHSVYPPSPTSPLHTMLTDTYTATIFFKDFTADPVGSLKWNALRQDSGDPFKFMNQAKEAWAEVEKLAGVQRGEDGVVAKGKRVVFSDGLDVEFAIRLQKGCDEIGLGGGFPLSSSDFRVVSSYTPSNVISRTS